MEPPTPAAPDVGSLERRWRDLWGRLGAQGDAGLVFAELVRRWSEPHRAYHTLVHLDEALAELDAARSQARQPDVVELAVWFHDAIYDPKARDNEQRSAEWAAQVLARAGLPAATGERVAELVLATQQHVAAPGDVDAQILLDADLSILGRPAARFDAYEAEIRREYAWVPADAFAVERARILRRMLERPVLYGTEHFRARLEAPARANLERSLAALAAPPTP
jgi:predicted metal-dependent HD superfamily phosphohydrolase